MTRKMAYIVKIDNLTPIEGADRIETAHIGGWTVVVKKGLHSVGNLVVFCEVDSWIPSTVDATLTPPEKEPREYQGVKGERLKTVRLRKQLSQGLVLPLCIFAELGIDKLITEDNLGEDVAEILGIQKWERPDDPSLRGGESRGNWPSEFSKTDLKRIQNIWGKDFDDLKNHTWCVEEKMEGSSATFALDLDGNFLVCSRNINLSGSSFLGFNDENVSRVIKAGDTFEMYGNTYIAASDVYQKESGQIGIDVEADNVWWKIARKLNIEEKMRAHCVNGTAIQGEIVGPGIQGNIYNLKDHQLFVFTIQTLGKFMKPKDRRNFVDKMGLTNVPLIDADMSLDGETCDSLLKFADGLSTLNKQQLREGLSFRANVDTGENVEFKTVSNKYLEKQDKKD